MSFIMVAYGAAGSRPRPQLAVERSSAAERNINIKVTAFVSMYGRFALPSRYDCDH